MKPDMRAYPGEPRTN